MRTWTLAVSVCAHAVAIGAVIVAPLFAADDLPEPRRPLTFEAIVPIEVPTVPVAPPPQTTQPSPATSSIPIIEPTALPPDTTPVVNVPADIVAPGGTGVPTEIFAPVGDPVSAPPPPRTSAPPVRVGSGIRAPTRISYTAPVYPPLAIASRIEGTVILEALIDENGNVRDVKVLRSIRLLDDPAVQAVSRWRFTPTLLNGTPVPVVMTVTVGFTLKQ